MLLLNREDIEKVFTIKDAIEADKKAFVAIEEKLCETPLRTNIRAPKYDGTFLFMPSYGENIDTAALKIINIFPRNIERGLPSSPAQILLIDGTTGLVIALLDGTYVTQLRTGGASGAAFDLLGRKDAKTGVLIGTGGQAPTQLEAMLAVRNLEKVLVYDANLQRARDFTQKMEKKLAHYHTAILPVATSAEAVKEGDLIITVTPSTTPVFDGTLVKPGATLSCVGSYQPHMQELDPALLPHVARIYFDDKEAVLSEAGDLILPLKKGELSSEKFAGNLGKVLKGTLEGRKTPEEILLFETVGTAVQDLITAKAIYDRALELGIGTPWN